MYSLVRSYTKELLSTPWKLDSVSTKTALTLRTEFRDVLLILENTYLLYPVQITLSKLKDILDTETIPEYLLRNDNKNLYTDPINEPNATVSARYIDAFQLGLTVDLIHPVSNTDTTREEKTDLSITSDKVTTMKLYETCVFTVNGLLHRSNYAGDKLQVVDGGLSLHKTNNSNIGVLNLGTLGLIKQYKVDCSEIVKVSSTTDLSSGLLVKVPVDPNALKGKTVLLSLGGYLYIPGNTGFETVGLGVFKLTLEHVPLLNRYFDSKDRISLNKYKYALGVNTLNPDLVSVEELYSDNGIKALFDMSQTFFIVIDTPDVYLDISPIEPLGLPGTYGTQTKPELPVMTNVGALEEYWTRLQDNTYVLSINNFIKPNYLYETTELKRPTDWVADEVVDNKLVPFNTGDYSRAYFLKLFKQVYKS